MWKLIWLLSDQIMTRGSRWMLALIGELS